MTQHPFNAPVLVPVGRIGGKLDNDARDYVFAPDIYLTLALSYDSLAAPTAYVDAQGIHQPNYQLMQPRLAVAWEEWENGDWIVRLRPDVISHAGNELTAADIAWTLDRATAQGVMGSWRWREVIGVERIEILDRHTLRYCLRAPYPTFPNWLLSVSPNVLDSTEIKAHAPPQDPWGVDWLNTHVAGFGGFDLTDMSDERLVYKSRPGYWAGQVETQAIELRRCESRAEAIKALDEPRPVVLVGLNPDETAALLKQHDLAVSRTWAGHVSVEIDFTRPPFDDVRVRSALARCTPVDLIIRDGLLGQGRRWRSPVKGVSQWYSDAGWDYEYDPAQARKLLREAGYANGFASDLYIAQRADSVRISEIIAKAWREIGVELTIRDVAGAPRGWLPPLFLRMECAHNLSDPIYDLVHDYAAMNPIFPLPGGEAHVGNWTPRWRKNEEAINRIGAVLLERDRRIKRRRFDDLQRWLIGFCSSVFIAEGLQVMASNRLVPASLVAPGSRFYQALNYQNCTTDYLPGR